MDALVSESARVGGASHIVDLLCLETGPHLGEATALRWEDCSFGRDASDTTRALRIPGESRSRGVHLGKTKSGRERIVAMSRRLRSARLAYQLEQGRPEGGDVALVDHGNYRKRHFRKLCEAAEIGWAVKADQVTRPRSPKGLRDTFASQLLTAAVQLGDVSRQLGHADVSVTARHYARWAGGDAYRSPLEVREDEVPADLLSRLAAVLFSDIVGYTGLMAESEAKGLRARGRARGDAAVRGHAGYTDSVSSPAAQSHGGGSGIKPANDLKVSKMLFS